MQAIVFDLDETLIDRHAAVTAFARNLWRDLSPGESHETAFVDEVHRLDDHGYTPRDVFFDAMLARFPGALRSIQAVSERFYAEVWETPRLADGAIEVLQALSRQNIQSAIVTNGSTRAQESKIVKSGLDDYIDVVVISDSFGVKKPDPSIYLEATTRLHTQPEHCWFIGDHPVNDIWGSKQVGFQSAWVHLDRSWHDSVKACYDVKGKTLKDTMSKLFDSAATQ